MTTETAERKYFLRRSGRITGPFSRAALDAMYEAGGIAAEDMFSEDKQQWRGVGELFPALVPDRPAAVAPELPDAPCADNADNAAPDAPETPPPALPTPNPTRTAKRHPVREFLADVGRTFALLWDFQGIMRRHSGKAGRFYAVAAALHPILGVACILLFARYYSRRFDHLLSPLMGLCLLAILLGAATLIGWGVARYCATKGGRTSPTWKLAAAGLFMNYGTLACCFLALFHGVRRYPWAWIVPVFVFTLVSCGSAMQLRDYLTGEGRPWRGVVILHALFVDPLLAAVIYGFAIII